MEFVKAAGQLRIPGEAEEGILIGFKRYSGVLLTLDNCLLPDERLSRSPSAEQGLPMDVEEQLRKQGCELIQAAGILLRLPQVAMATGQILFQRFFYCKSFIRHCVENVAMACVHLASKIEEEPRRVRDVINVFHRLKQDRECGVPAPLPLDGSYVNMKNQVIVAERRVLKELGFCVHVKHPHKIIVMYLQVLECEKNTQLVQTAWNYMNDSLRTDVFLRFSAEMVACACIYLAARSLQIPLPDSPPWFLLFGATEEDLKGICCRVLRLYLLPSVPLSALQERVTECRRVLEATRAKSALMGPLLLANGTPTLEPPSSFSPASKPSSPHTVTQVSRDSPQSQAALKDARRNLANGKIRLSHSDERKEVPHASPPRSPRRRRSRSVASPPRSLSPTRRKKQPGGYQRERERERERGRRREREREKERGRKDRVSSHRRVTDEGRVHTDQTSRLLQ